MTGTVHQAWHLVTCVHLMSTFADVIVQIGRLKCSNMAAAGSQGNHLLTDLAFEHAWLSQTRQKARPSHTCINHTFWKHTFLPPTSVHKL